VHEPPVLGYFDGLGDFDPLYVENRYLQDLAANGYSSASVPAGYVGPPLDALLAKLENLLRRIDGCGATAGSNDWIADCAAEVEIRALVELLIANLEAP
jgi:hypothetical protein